MKNAVLPYVLIAVIGIVATVIISVIGLNQQQEIADGGDEQVEENGGEEVAEGSTEEDAGDAVYQTNCAACHGADLSGGAGPELTTVGASYSEEEIQDIIQNGMGGMPAIPAVAGEELDAISSWLAAKQ